MSDQDGGFSVDKDAVKDKIHSVRVNSDHSNDAKDIVTVYLAVKKEMKEAEKIIGTPDSATAAILAAAIWKGR